MTTSPNAPVKAKTMGEIARMLRRYIARAIYATLPRPT